MTDKSYNKAVLQNGIRIVTESHDHVRSAAIGVFITNGSRNETPDNYGAAHFLEHAVFKGTTNRDSFSIAASIESLGGSLNAATSEEFTCFFARVLDEHLPQAIDVLSDLIQNALLEEDVIELEKGVVLEEIKGVKDTPSQLVIENFISCLYPEHTLGIPILGTEKTIRSMQKRHLVNFRDENYTTDRIIVAVAGNLSHEEIVKQVDQHFSLTATVSDVEKVSPNGVSKTGLYTTEAQIKQSHICLGCRALHHSDERRYAFLVMNAILSGGMSTRLFQNIREKYGFVYSIYSFADFLSDTGYYGVYAGTDDRKTDEVINLIKKEFDDIAFHLVSDEELLSAKAQLKGGMLISMESMAHRMNRLAIREMYFGSYMPIDELIECIDAVTAEELMSVASSILKEEQLCTTVIKPDGKSLSHTDV